MDADESKTVELAAVIREIQDRVRARYPINAAGDGSIPLADLMPAVHARDKAEAKVAAIGSVNPRPPGFPNNLIQSFKRTVARSLNWFVREQVEFNRASIDCINALIEAVNESNRAVAALASQSEKRFADMRGELAAQSEKVDRAVDAIKGETTELKDIRKHWIEWRQDWERKLSINEVQFLRSVADLQAAFQHRATLMESNFRDLTASQHKDFTVALDRARLDIQDRLWADLEKVRGEYDKLIHSELRVMRQRGPVSSGFVAPAPPPQAAAAEGPDIDLLRFSERFRGSEEYVRQSLRRHVKRFEGCVEVLDLGCGRGEFLECLREEGILARGVESNEELAAYCESKGLYVEHADLFQFLTELAEHSVDGIFCSQVVEHLPAAKLPQLLRLCAVALRRGGRLVIETPNPECLAIFASHFYIDPTHQRPVPASLLAFYLEEAGFGQITVDYLNPVSESMPSVNQLPAEFRQAFFHGLDYAIAAKRL